MTREHVPAKGLFEKPRPSNLNRIPCCFNCNNSYSKEDEYFRLAASCLINTNSKGKSVWKNKVLESTLKKGRIQSLIDDLKQTLKPRTLDTPFGKMRAVEFAVDAHLVQSVLIRLTKGLLYLTHPEIDRSQLKFEITQIDQFKLHSIVSSGVHGTFTEYSLGEGVYHHWRAISAEDNRCGVWVHLFYGACCFIVAHAPDGHPFLNGLEAPPPIRETEVRP